MDVLQTQIILTAMASMDYSALRVIPGGPEALASMVEFGHEVMLCTSPWLDNPTCIKGKFEWVDQHLGPEWVDKVVITKDKTVVNGDWLVDDKPSITGYQQQPAWTHILFDQPYNQHVTGQPRLMTWDDWDNERVK
jgi:5'-nucleotidase